MDSAPPIIAVDPGASGGIAWRIGTEVHATSMPKTEGDIVALFRGFAPAPAMTPVVYIEEVGGYINGHGAPGSAMFNFGRGFGFLLGTIMALGLRVELVRPQKWQAPLSLGGRKSCATPNEWKNKLKACAQRKFPTVAVTLSTADALLILDYAER